MAGEDGNKRFIGGSDSERDHMIARLLERTEWMREQGERMVAVTERLERATMTSQKTLSELSGTVKLLADGHREISGILQRVAVIEEKQKWWDSVKNGTAKYTLIAVGVIVLLAVSLFGLKGKLL